MWHEPSLLLLHPSISKAMRQYRANNLGQALINAASVGLPGAIYPWESTGRGYNFGGTKGNLGAEVRLPLQVYACVQLN